MYREHAPIGLEDGGNMFTWLMYREHAPIGLEDGGKCIYLINV